MDEQQAIGECHDPRHVLDARKDSLRRGDGLRSHLSHAQDLVYRQGQESTACPGHQEPGGQAVLARGKAEATPKIENRENLSMEIDDSEGNGRGLRERRHGDHR
jgi:hypothetical protein